MDLNCANVCTIQSNKYLLRRAMNGIVPSIVLESTKKVGFNAPIEQLVNFSHIKGWLFRPSAIWEIVDVEKVDKLIKKKEFTNAESKFLFNILNMKIFLEEYGG